MTKSYKINWIREISLISSLMLLSSFYAIAQVPTITSFSPMSGPIGTSVTITGTNFDTTPANNIVFFGATQATVSAASATELTVTVPTGATYMPITVLVSGLMAYSLATFVVTFEGAGINTNSFDAKVDYPTEGEPLSVSISDLDGDGKADLAVVNAGSNTVSVFRNTSPSAGTISYAIKADYTTGSSPRSVSIGDLDGDGKADLVVANSTSRSVSVFRNTSPSAGTISCADKVDFTTGSDPYSVSIGDLDGDGKADLAVVNLNSNTVSVFRNTSPSPGTISFDFKVDFPTGTRPISVSIGDLDGDGKADLAVTNLNSNTVSVFRNTSPSAGTISYATKVDFPTGSGPFSVSIGDLDGDGKADLAVANQGSNTVSVFRNTSPSPGTISYATKVDYPTGSFPLSVSIGDLDGDGKADLAVVNISSNTVSVFRNTSPSPGTINYATKVDYPTGNDPQPVSIGDLDGDGKADLAVANIASNTVSVFRNTSTPKEILTFSLPEQTDPATIDADNHTIDIEVFFDTDVTALISTFTLSSGATAQVSSTDQTSATTANDFTSPVTYTITAEDGTSTQNWTVTVTTAPNIETDITAFSFREQTGMATPNTTVHSVDIGVVFGTDVSALASTFTLSSGATAKVNTTSQVSGVTKNDFTSPVTYTITAEDGSTTQDWTVTVNSAPTIETTTFMVTENSANGTSVGTVSATDIDGDGLTYSITDGNTGNTFAINAATGEISINDSTSLDFELIGSFSLTVEVTDGNATASAVITISIVEEGFLLTGVVSDLSNTIITDAEVVLIIQTTTGFDELEGLNLSTDNNFIFTGLETGVYAVKVIPGSGIENNYFITYSGNKISLVEADLITVDGNEVVTILMVEKPVQQGNGGEGVITGTLSDPTASGRQQIAALVGVYVFLLDTQTGEIIGFDTTDSNGEFTFTGLLAGDYVLSVDYEGLSVDGTAITVGEESEPVVLELEVTMTGIVTRVVEVTGIGDFIEAGISIYPVPSSAFVNISIEDVNDGNYQLELITIKGRVLRSHKIRSKLMTIDIRDLQQGVYLLIIANGKASITQRIVKN